VLAGDEETGVTIMRMEEGLDTGPGCVVRRTPVAEKTVPELTTELAQLGAVAILEALTALEAGTCEWVPQDESAATYAEKIEKREVALAPDLNALESLRRVRASSDRAPSRARIAEREVTVVAAAPSAMKAEPGSVLATSTGIVLGCADSAIEVLRLRPSGKSVMAAADWARGLRLTGPETWRAAQ